MPRHVAVIMDGNGRWAKERGLPRLEGHRAGTRAIRDVVDTAPRIGIEYLTLYAFSVENWRRPQTEVSGLMDLFKQVLEQELPELDKNGVRLRVLGHLEELPAATALAFRSAMRLTAKNSTLNLNLALNYGGRQEIADAVKSVIKQAFAEADEQSGSAPKSGEHEAPKPSGDARQKSLSRAITPQGIANHLYTAGQPDPELVIRTSGELRISNFLLWQIAYAELWVTPVFWPDFTKRLFLEAIYDFQKRRRRFGGLDLDQLG